MERSRAPDTTSPEGPVSPHKQAERERQEGNQLLAGGAAIGAVGVAGAVLVGATCPLCVVAAPALVGAGLYRRWRAARSCSEAAQRGEAWSPAATISHEGKASPPPGDQAISRGRR